MKEVNFMVCSLGEMYILQADIEDWDDRGDFLMKIVEKSQKI